jgi:ribosomal protein S18 acetylase RimI-like enzyme
MTTPSSIDLEPGERTTDHVEVRALSPADLDWIVQIDRQYTGRPRSAYYRLKLSEAQTDTGIRISLAAIVKGEPAGFLIGRLYYGEFGAPEPVALLDSIGVSNAFAGQRVGKALLQKLAAHVAELGIERIQTLVAWDQPELLGFFRHAGFQPAPRLCLELDARASWLGDD